MVQLVYYSFNLHAIPGNQLALIFVVGIWKIGDQTTFFLKSRTKELGGLGVKHLPLLYTTDSDLFLSWPFSDLLVKGKILKKCLINMCT